MFKAPEIPKRRKKKKKEKKEKKKKKEKERKKKDRVWIQGCKNGSHTSAGMSFISTVFQFVFTALGE